MTFIQSFLSFFMPGYDSETLLVIKKTKALLFTNLLIGTLLIFFIPSSLLTGDQFMALVLGIGSMVIFGSCFLIRAHHYLLANYFTSALCFLIITLDLFSSTGEEMTLYLLYRGAFTLTVLLIGNTFFSLKRYQPLIFFLLSYLLLLVFYQFKIAVQVHSPQDLVWSVFLNCFLLLLAAGLFGFLLIGFSEDLITSSEEKSLQLKNYSENLQKIVEEKTADLLRMNLQLLKEIEEREKGEKRFRDLANLLPETVYETDDLGQVTFINRKGIETFGITEKEIQCGLNAFQIFIGDEKSRAMAKRMQTIREGEVSRAEYWVQRKDGSSLPVCIYTAPIIQEQKILGTRGFIIDITEQKKIEEILRRSNEELRQFAYIASHDLKEPLRTVVSFLDLVKKKLNKTGMPDQEVLDFIDFASNGARRMNNLISDLLEYSRIQREDPEPESVDLNDVVANVLLNLKTAIQEKQAVIQVAPLPDTCGKRSHFLIVFQNLIENAIKYQAKNAIPMIQITARESGKDHEIRVKDNGIGIDPPYLEKVFQIFQRLHPYEKYAGTGIGLAICKKIVEKYGGTIWVESEKEKGSDFVFTLPKT